MSKQKATRWKLQKARTKDSAAGRLHKVFGLSGNESLPDVDDNSMEVYYEHLDRNLSLPAAARYCPNFSPRSARAPKVSVLALDRNYRWDDEVGILCQVAMSEGEVVVPLLDLAFSRSDRNYQLAKDFSEWFADDIAARSDCESEEDEEDDDYESDREEDRSGVPSIYSISAILSLCILCTLIGGVLGSAVTAMSWAAWAAIVGSILCGTVVSIGFSLRAQTELQKVPPLVSAVFGGLYGLFWGAVAGAFFGTAIVGILGTIPGYIVGKLLDRFATQKNRAIFMFLPGWPTIAVGCGVFAESLFWNRASALQGLAYGAGIGICVAVATWLCVAALNSYCSKVE